MLQTKGLVLIQVLGARKGPGVAGKTLSTLGREGINVIGGCCGTTPDHIRAFRPLVDAHNAG